MNVMGNSNIPLFSIIIPVYNVSNYIEVTVGSILSQTYSNFELLLIDDGSIDGSSELLDKMEQNDKRIRVFHQPNSGVSAARNLGLENAVGEWIVFVDGDDALITNALKILKECIDTHPLADLIGYSFITVGCITPEIINDYANSDCSISKETDCSDQIPFEALDHYTVWSEIFRRKILNEMRFEPLKNGEDLLFCNGIGIKANHYVSLKAPLYIYLQRETSANNNHWTKRRHHDYEMQNNGIMSNITSCKKKIDNAWLKRWVGSLLQYKPEAWKFDISDQQKYFSNHRSLLKKANRLHSIPHYLKIWIAIATAFNSKEYFRVTAMLPMKIYSKIRR